jgi:hypothetical protein
MDETPHTGPDATETVVHAPIQVQDHIRRGKGKRLEDAPL